METFTIKDLTFSYPNSNTTALNNFSLSVLKGEFIALCGKSGCGKSTLLRHLKTDLTPYGTRSGQILFQGNELENIDRRIQSSKIGYVVQSPDNQIVTDKVWHELAFGLESLGISQNEIRLKVAEMASFFGIQEWFHKSVSELSGGQKQLLNLASIMAMQPDVLILDEPTSQLDPIAASEFLAAIGKINREIGTTIILSEHRLEEVIPLSDRIVVMDNGKIISSGKATNVGMELRSIQSEMFLAMPAPMRVYSRIDNDLDCPVTVRDGRVFLEKLSKLTECKKELETDSSDISHSKIPTIELKEIWFKYEKELPNIVKGLSFKAYEGEICAILGGNGTGKTTTLSLISGLRKPYRGKVLINGLTFDNINDNEKFDGLLGVLPQNPQTLFVHKTLELDLLEILSDRKINKEWKKQKLDYVVELCVLEELLDRHPYDLSGGEQQRAALAKILLLEPKILLLDEPTKGLDAYFKHKIANILFNLKREGITIIMVSHDIEFCASFADRCAMFFDGAIIAEDKPRKFFTGNSFYTTSANRMARELIPQAITANDIISSFGGRKEVLEFRSLPKPLNNHAKGTKKEGFSNSNSEKQLNILSTRKNTMKKWILTVLSTLIFVSLTFFVSNYIDYEMSVYIPVLLILETALPFYIIFEGWKYKSDFQLQPKVKDRKLIKRTIIATLIILLFIPLTIWFGIYYLSDRKYYFISLLVILETMLPFFMIFEQRKPQARELIVISVLCAVGVGGRMAFFWVPQFKPVAAIVIISGVAFGGEAGFLVGAMTAFVSNYFFGQGPWTPWQMFAFGIIGFFAGVLFRKGILRQNAVALSIFGGITTFIIYGIIMNISSVLMVQSKLTMELVIAACILGIPFDLIHGISTFVFLFVFSKPMLEKLDRIKIKYGLIT